MDKYQERYEEHIQNKMKRDQKKHLYSFNTIKGVYSVIENRKSVRRYNGEKLGGVIYDIIYKALDESPSSCNRKGIYAEEVSPDYAERVLVGGSGWANKADKVFFLFGAKECYKNPKEVAFMPYLDAGFVGQNIYILCELHGVGCCFINPNIREELDNKDYFCGAFAVGNYV